MLRNKCDLDFSPVAELNANTFWRSPFTSLCDPHQLTEYTVLQVERIGDGDMRHVKGGGAKSKKVSIHGDCCLIIVHQWS